ncbi:MAG TPA: hypothetical protein VM912_23290 [Terriglobales bacterium]|nr:hypothetical protein [Terriglobales bacterium]
MVCKDLKDEIFEAALSGTAPGDSAKVHMATCSACEQEFQSLRSTMNVLDTWTAPEPSQYFDVRLRARLREVKEHEQHTLVSRLLEKIGMGGRFSWKPLTAAAFTMIMAVAGGLYVVNGPVQGKSGKNVIEAACPVVDLRALDQNQQMLSALQDLDDDSSNNTPEQVSE